MFYCLTNGFNSQEKRSYDREDLRDRTNDFENYPISIDYFRDGVGDLNKTLYIVQEFDKAYPHQAFPLLHLGDIYLHLGRSEGALPPLLESIQFERTASSYGQALIALTRLNRLDEAKKLIQESRARKIEEIILDAHCLPGIRRLWRSNTIHSLNYQMQFV
jgi:hypothetical protein